MDETTEFSHLDKLCNFDQFDAKVMEYYGYNIGYKDNKMDMESIPDFMAV